MGSFGSRGGLRHVVPALSQPLKTFTPFKETAEKVPLQSCPKAQLPKPFIDLHLKRDNAANNALEKPNGE
jgi:hypothetical protein